MLKRILAATDFSANADSAWRFALELATSVNGELLLLHVMTPLGATGPVEVQQDHERRAAVARRLLAERAAQATSAALDVKTIVGRGDPAEVIAATAHQERVDVIVVGTHGHRESADVLIGSVAERVLRRAPCTVIIGKPTPTNAAGSEAA